MEGFPTNMIEAVEQFEQGACALSAGAFAVRPRMYHEHPNPRDLTCVAWNEVVELTTRAMNAVEALGNIYRKEAGITTPGPTAAFFDETEDPSADTGIGPDGNGSATKA